VYTVQESYISCILYFKYIIESILYFKYFSSYVVVFCISNTLQAMYLYFVFQIQTACI